MKKEIVLRTLSEADYILKTEKTIREVSKEFNISKSTVHKDLSERLKDISKEKFDKVSKIMQNHIDIRHIRGGESTRKKYKKIK